MAPIRTPNLHCPACGQQNFIAAELVSTPIMQGKNINFGGPTVPLVFSAVTDGIDELRMYAGMIRKGQSHALDGERLIK